MCRSMVEIQSVAAEIRRGKKKKKDRNHRMKIYMVSLLHRATINNLVFYNDILTSQFCTVIYDSLLCQLVVECTVRCCLQNPENL